MTGNSKKLKGKKHNDENLRMCLSIKSGSLGHIKEFCRVYDRKISELMRFATIQYISEEAKKNGDIRFKNILY